MDNSQSKSTNSAFTNGISPFARAMQEAKAGDQSRVSGGDFDGLSNFADGQFNPALGNQLEAQKKQMEQLKLRQMRERLHRQINPVETTDIFNAQHARVKKQIDEVRHELTLMMQEVAVFQSQIEVSVMANVPDGGAEGKYHFAFFEKLKALIQLLRQQIHSAQTWATTLQSKKRKRGQGLEIAGQQYEQTKAIYDRSHHENATQYSGN